MKVAFNKVYPRMTLLDVVSRIPKSVIQSSNTGPIKNSLVYHMINEVEHIGFILDKYITLVNNRSLRPLNRTQPIYTTESFASMRNNILSQIPNIYEARNYRITATQEVIDISNNCIAGAMVQLKPGEPRCYIISEELERAYGSRISSQSLTNIGAQKRVMEQEAINELLFFNFDVSSNNIEEEINTLNHAKELAKDAAKGIAITTATLRA